MSKGRRRDELVVASKVGYFHGTAALAYDPWHIRRQCEQSLRNRRRDCIDLYDFLHGDFVGPNEDGRRKDYLHECMETMRDLVREGKVRCVGLSGSNIDELERAVPVLKPDAIQMKAYLQRDESIREGSRMHKLLRAHGCSLVAFGPLDQVTLLDKFEPDAPPRWESGEYRSTHKDFAPESLRAVRAMLVKVRGRYHPSLERCTIADTRVLASLAQRWVLAHEGVCSVIPGFRNEAQARCNVGASDDPPPGSEDVSWLREVFSI